MNYIDHCATSTPETFFGLRSCWVVAGFPVLNKWHDQEAFKIGGGDPSSIQAISKHLFLVVVLSFQFFLMVLMTIQNHYRMGYVLMSHGCRCQGTALRHPESLPMMAAMTLDYAKICNENAAETRRGFLEGIKSQMSTTCAKSPWVPMPSASHSIRSWQLSNPESAGAKAIDWFEFFKSFIMIQYFSYTISLSAKNNRQQSETVFWTETLWSPKYDQLLMPDPWYAWHSEGFGYWRNSHHWMQEPEEMENRPLWWWWCWWICKLSM